MERSKLSGKSRITLRRKMRKALNAPPDDTVVFELDQGVVKLKGIEPSDAAFHAALVSTFDEWTTEADEAAFRDL